MTLHGTGCCLIDNLYASVDFSGPAFRKALSRRAGDGGLTPGKLVFAEDFERFRGTPYESALAELVDGAEPDARNLGGPSIVALAHAAQMAEGGPSGEAPEKKSGGADSHVVRYFGFRGDDDNGRLIESFLSRLPLDGSILSVVDGPTPRTDVLSDPGYDDGHGERTFINLLGTAGIFGPEGLEDAFFDADVVAFGGTALVPRLHAGLTGMLRKAKARDAATVVNLVYDFPAEQRAPDGKWPLGADDDAYGYIDLLVADREEALRYSGCTDASTAAAWFAGRGVGAVVITEGARDVRILSGGPLFAPLSSRAIPVAAAIDEEIAAHPELLGDTTGCGDNFAGGLLFSLMDQLRTAGRGRLDLMEACSWAVASGGFARFSVGGTYYETAPGEKRRRLEPYVGRYREQAGIAKPQRLG